MWTIHLTRGMSFPSPFPAPFLACSRRSHGGYPRKPRNGDDPCGVRTWLAGCSFPPPFLACSRRGGFLRNARNGDDSRAYWRLSSLTGTTTSRCRKRRPKHGSASLVHDSRSRSNSGPRRSSRTVPDGSASRGSMNLNRSSVSSSGHTASQVRAPQSRLFGCVEKLLFCNPPTGQTLVHVSTVDSACAVLVGRGFARCRREPAW